MVTTVTREHETAEVAEQIEPGVIAAPASPPVDISAVPESPAELLKRWDSPKRPLIHIVVANTLVRIWDAITGPGMTEQDRIRREIAEVSGSVRVYGPHV